MQNVARKTIRMVMKIARTVVLLLAAGASGGTVWATDYTFSNVDETSLASYSDPSYGTQSFTFKLNDPSAKLAVGDFPSSGYVQLTSISLSGRSGMNGYKTATKAVLTNNKTSESYTAAVTYNDNAFIAAMDPDKISDASRRAWTRMEVLMTFSTDGVLVDTDATYTLTFKNSSGNNATMGYSVVKNDSLSIGWTPAMRIYGRTPSGSMELPSSLIPSSGGITLPSTVTVADVTGMILADDSVTIGNSGIQMACTTQPITLMMKVENIPSTASVLAGLELSGKGAEIVPTRTATGFQNGWVSTNGGNLGNNNNSGWGVASTTSVASGEHWLTVAYASDTSYYGMNSYLDGVGVACTSDPNGLRWTSGALTAVTVGGSKASVNNYTASKGMIIKDVQIYSGKLTAVQVAKAEAAAAAGWAPSGTTGLVWSSSEGAALPGHAAVMAIGSITIGNDGSLDLSGITQAMVSSGGSVDLSKASGLTAVSVLSGGTATLGLQRPTQVVVMEGGTLNLTAGTMSDIITGYTPTATLTTQSAAMFAGTITLNGETVTPVIDGATVTLTGTYVAGNPSYTGSSYWWDYEFNGNGNNIGSEQGGLSFDASRPTVTGGSAESLGDYTSAVDGNQAIHLLARPWRHVDGASGSSGTSGYPSEFTAVMYCKAGSTANGVLVAFGSGNRGSSQKIIALTTGSNPENGEMRLVLINGQSSAAVDLVEGGFTLDNITSANHLYAFTVKTVAGNSQISVYADGDLLTTYEASGVISLGNGFQIGSIHGSITSDMKLNYLADGSSGDPDTATLDFLRVMEGELTSAAISALAAEYPYVSPNGIATRTVSASGTWSDDTNTPWSQKTLNQDGSSTTTDQAAPNSGTVVDVIATADATLTMNLDSAVTYEKLTFEGAGAITVVKGGTAPTVTTRTYIKTNTTLPVDAFASLGAITVDAGKTLTLIPASSTTYTALGLGIRGTASSVVTGTVTLGDGATVALDANTVTEYAAAGISLTLEQNASLQYVLTIERQDGDVTITKAANGWETATMGGEYYQLPAIPASIPADFANSVTIVNNNASEFTVATVFNGGTVPVTVNSSSAPVVLTGDSTFGGAVSGTATLTISGNITLASGGSIANTIAGAGTVTLSSLSQTLTFGAWTGTVVLPALTANQAYNFNNYGASGSTVRLTSGFSTGWLANATMNPAIEIPSGQSFTLGAFSPSFANAFAALKGDGMFAITATANQDNDLANVATWGAGLDHYSAYFRIGDVSGFHGSITTTSDVGVALGSSKPSKNTTGGKILVYGNATVGETATWTAPNGVLLMAANATLAVPSGATVPTPTSGVSGYIVQSATSDGTTTYSLTEQITVDDAEVGYMDNTTAVITNTTAAVTVPASATEVALAFSTGSEITLTSTTTLTTDNVTVYATDADGQKTSTDISSAFKVTTGENNTYTIELNEEVVQKNVTPTTFAEDGTPTLSMTAIPGLWYQVLAADSVNGGALVSPAGGMAVQATTTTVSPAAPEFTGTVKFYKIAVGASRAALQ